MNLMAYRDRAAFQRLLQLIEPQLARARERTGRKIRFMEVCGTHSVAFSRSGVRDLLSPYVELVSGPGCPVCVTDQSDINQMIAYAGLKDVIVVTFGDMMKVPGSRSNLEREKSNGADVRVVKSASHAVDIARRHPSSKIVFLGVGFETTAPGIALSLKKAKEDRLQNFFVYSAHKLTPPALDVLLADHAHRLDGFVLPGHVSVIIGRKGWVHLEQQNVPAVIGGFDAMDLLLAIGALTREMSRTRRHVRNLYPRVVQEEGNLTAQRILTECFETASPVWRGFGPMEHSGLRIHPDYADLDAACRIQTDKPVTAVIKGCRCGEVVKGKETPLHCKLFAKACTPASPLGPCMVSSEGACSTYFQYERNKETVQI
ncbi:hydrogenase formation protein HypD [Paenibacillus thiaminolyticus]|uniref:Hydrogenase formation protein HypD n=1 Tax=Paenibacillus thiaminolyticus TaxID=49283 RepID=A0AAP9IZT7_PANTH|nr:hydrogenase formation protein HypD [Paenibacillus thiaminolyticus]MCY9538019.1 hydrogenase formation protein HypD [Paenibacillus thiaminolyticus]MCY9604915.1 hydrogenase formation protein HypD [Paenibacillus thiaminolyticus]MCY9610650.1 hydrogenase formation protein HypD [Paenibacillus thiaminolyticus]MCY9615978.1 hydrogenase formation protein HypD [Paenibacillus thiaminolyticus]MCY9622384.1 hydrogenase formation protein HypD [Paenibacillus thiaminolyticus]